jgi:hypothetical protein
LFLLKLLFVLALDVMAEAVFIYDFDTLTHDDLIIEVRPPCVLALDVISKVESNYTFGSLNYDERIT